MDDMKDFYNLIHDSKKQTSPPIVFHISGSPGSGKSTLVVKLKQTIPDMYVIDTDDMLEDTDPLVIQMRQLDQATEAYVTLWKRAVRNGIIRHIEIARSRGKKCIVFAGILRNFNGPLGGIVDISDLVQHAYFLCPPLPTLLCQFYTRFETFKSYPDFWEDIASGKYDVPNSKEYKKSHEEEKEWHVQHGYKIVETQERIMEIIVRECNK